MTIEAIAVALSILATVAGPVVGRYHPQLFIERKP